MQIVTDPNPAGTALWGRLREAAYRSSLLHRYWYPLSALARRDMSRTYGRTSLGRGWMVLHPALLMALYILVFGFILRIRVVPGGGPGEFAIFLMSGMLPYFALCEGIQRSNYSLSENRGLLDQAVFPAEVMPLAGVIGASLIEGIGLGVLIVAMLWQGPALTVWLLALPLVVVLRMLLTAGMSCLTSVLVVFIPDLRELLGFLLTVWLFLTPIFYSPQTTPVEMGPLLQINPLHAMVSAYRAVIFGQTGAAWAMLKAAVWAVSIFAFGIWFFRKSVERARDLL
jgi:ABC-type polysaccharide/polyol phosphate export permease